MRPRIRSMKPEAFQHRKVGRLSIWARWLWVGLLHHADDAGRFIADAGELLARFFGYDRDVPESKVEEWLAEVAATGLVILYRAEDGTPLGYFPDWHEHQRIDRPKPSTLPAPPVPPRPSRRPHRRTGRPPFGRAPDAQAPEAQHSEDLPSTTDRRRIDDGSPTDRRVDRIGSDRDLDLETPPKRPAADAAVSVDVEAELLGLQSNGHDPAPDPPPVGEGHRPARPAPPASSVGDGFGDFWAVYPRKKDRDRAEKAWRKLAPDADLRAVILAAVERQKRSEQWRRDGGQYIPHAATWINGKRWTDEDDRPTADDRTGISERWAGVTPGKVTL